MITPKIIAACALFMSAKTAFAHGGHGLAGTHWHAADAWALLAVAAVVTAAAWLFRKDKA